MRLQWLIAALFLCAALFVLQWWAIAHHIFWYFVWFDLPMHFLGGFALGVLAVGILRTRRPRLFLLGLTFAFVAWEVFEYVFGVPKEANYWFDTSIDLLMDTLGALFAYVIARCSVWKA